MKPKRVLIRAFADEYIAGKANKYIRKFRLRPGDRVLILARKSGIERGNNLDQQVANLRRVVEAAGAIVVDDYKYTGSGWFPQIGCAACRAKERRATIMLAETTDRVVRNLHYHSVKRPDLQATNAQLAEVARDCDRYGIRLMTHLDPDASPSEARGYQSKRGQRFKGRRGGRPKNRTPGYMTERWEEKIGLVLFLHRRGWPIRRIAAKRMVSVPKSTVHEWIQKHS